ncbi:MAG: DUF2079 domain-containing protein [Anaerolineae bacterium]
MGARTRYRLAFALVWILILAYGVYFSAYSIQRHRAFLTHASDLGQIDQAIWNTLQGRILEHTKATGVQNIRLSDHVEPVFVPISLVFLLYDNVEALLILQSFAIAIGALAIFWIAHKRFVETFRWNVSTGITSAWPEIAGVLFAALYLLFPALEAANLAEFHAVVLAPAPLLFAYYYGTEKAWGRFALFALLALATQEGISLLVMFLAGWFVISDYELRITNYKLVISQLKDELVRFIRYLFSAPRVPLALAILSFVWFGLTYFVIIPRFNTLGRSPYTCRYIVSEDCRTAVQGLFLDQRLGYLGGLLASVGWIALLDPLGLLLGLPMIVANTISNYPGQYSGTFHYSAPVAPYFVLAAIGGSARAVAWLKPRPFLLRLPAYLNPYTLVLIPIALFALGYHLLAGYTPIGGGFTWPVITPHNQLLEQFLAEIPPDARVSTTGSLNPHLSHRRVLYRYPVVNDADYVMLDVNESDSGNPTDFRVAYDDLIKNQGFNVVDAADGYVLLQRGAPAKPFPIAFYSIFRANDKPQHPTTIDIGGKIRLVGYDVLTDQYGRVSIQYYWQRLAPMDKNYYLYPFYAGADGQPREDVTLPLTLLYWYPTAAWQADETVVSRTVPQDVGPQATLGLGVIDGDDWQNQDNRLPVRVIQPANLPVMDDGTWVQLGMLKKVGNIYVTSREEDK